MRKKPETKRKKTRFGKSGPLSGKPRLRDSTLKIPDTNIQSARLKTELEELRACLADAQETLNAIRCGEVDALLVSKAGDDQVFTLKGADHAYRVLVEEMNEGAATLNPEGIILFCNNSLASMLEMPLEKVIGSYLRSYIADDSLRSFDQFINRTFRESGKLEVKLQKENGKLIAALLSGRKLSLDNVTGISIVVTDISLQKQAQEVLRRGHDELEKIVQERTSELGIHQVELEIQNEELRVAQEELETSRKKYADLYNLAPIGYFSLDSEGIIKEANFAGCELLGYDKYSLLETPFSLYIADSQDRSVFSSHQKEASASHFRANCEIRLRRNDRTFFYAQLQSIAVGNGVDKADYIRTAVVDMTDRKRSEERMRIKDNAIASSINGMAFADLQGNLTYVNSSFLQMWGYDHLQEILGKHVRDFWESGGAAMQVVEAIGREGSWSGEMTAKKKDGLPFIVLVYATLVRNDKGEPLCMMASFNDITERKRAEQKIDRLNQDLHRRISELETIFKTVPIGLAIAEAADGLHIRGNPANEQLVGVPDGGELSKAAPEPPDFRVFDGERELRVEELPMQRAVRGEEVRGQIIDVVREDGRIVNLLCSSAPLYDEQGRPRGAVGAFLDITDLKQAEAKIRRQHAVLKGINTIFQAALNSDTEEELGLACLEVAEEATQSRFGFIGEIGPDGLLHDIAISNPGWELCTMYDKTGHRRAPGNFKLHGLYGRVLIDQKSFFTNDASSHPDSIGIPKGHPPLKAFLGAPLIDNGKTIGMIAVANPLHNRGYGLQDLEALERMATAVVQVFLRKRAEKALQRERDLLQAVMNGAKNSHLVYLDRDFNFVRVNEAYAATCGYRPEEMIGKNHFALYPHAENEAIFARVRDTGEAVEIHDKPFEFPDQPGRGVTYWDWTLTPVKDPAGNVEGLIFSLHETTERKLAEKALRESEQRFRTLSDATFEGIAISENGHVIEANEQFAAMHGYSPAEVLGKQIGDFVALEERENLLQAFRRGAERVTEYRAIRKDGSAFFVEVHGKTIEEGGRRLRVSAIRDITERKLTEEALHKNEERLREYVKLLEYAPVMVRNMNDEIILWNSGMERMYRYSPAEAIGRKCRDLLQTVFPQPPEQILDIVNHTGRWEGDLQYVTGEGHKIIVTSLWVLHKNPEGKATAIIEVNSDITDRRRAQEELLRLNQELEGRVRARTADLARTITTLQNEIEDRREAEDALRESQFNLSKAQSIAHIGSWSYDLKTEKFVSSAEFYNIFGLKPDDKADLRTIVDIIHPEDREKVRASVRELMSNLKARPLEYRIILPGGTARVVWTEAEMLFDAAHRPLSVVGTVQDITEHKSAEEELIRLATAVESAADALVITEPGRGIIQYVNPAFEKITGYSRDEAVGRDLHMLESGRQGKEFFRELRDTLKQNGVWTGRMVHKKKDGTLYEEECTYSPVKNASGEVINYISIKRDVTEKVRLESIAQAVDTMNNIGYIFAGVSHEIGNPINAIRITLDIMQRKLEVLPKENVAEYLNRLMGQVQRVEYLLKGLKNFNMYESLQPDIIDLASFLEAFLSMVKKDFEAKGIRIETVHQPDAKCAYADPRALQQVLLNIFTNASDALQGREDPKIAVSISASPGLARIQVKDNGPGIAESKLKDLFKPFYTTKKHGTGLGLVIIKKMMARMNGTVQITSRFNEGTAVELSLPCEKVETDD